MFGLFKKKDRQVSDEDLEIVATHLKLMAYDLTSHGVVVAKLLLKRGHSHVAVALFIALTTMAFDVRAADSDFETLMSYHTHATELLPLLKIYKDKGAIKDEVWKYYATAICGVATIDKDQEAWIERILNGNVAGTERPAISRVTKPLYERQDSSEDAARQKIDRALLTLGLELPTQTDKCQHSISTAQSVVKVVMERAGRPSTVAHEDDKFVGGLLAFVASDIISRMEGTEFEIVSSVAVIGLFYDAHNAAEGGELVREVANAFNGLAREKPQLLQAIGQNITKWFDEPTDAQLSKLADLFGVCRENISRG